jgi:uncharacterized Fe-S cluster-containing radical SAM superfamily protein
MYNPADLAETIGRSVLQDNKRKYYRLARGGKWYGGIATADCLGCQLKCLFCWSGQREKYRTLGRFYSPDQVVHALRQCAKKNRYRLLRLSGNEPTLGGTHLLEILTLLREKDYLFILETNGLLIDRDYARALSSFKNVHVRVSLKGTNGGEFEKLTGAPSEFFDDQIDALGHLVSFDVSCNPACMLSFSPRRNREALLSRLSAVDPGLALDFEEEYLILYPHVEEKLKRAGLTPVQAFSPR